MSESEQAAFCAAYQTSVASAPMFYVKRFVQRVANGNDMPYDEYYTSVMDAFCLWNRAKDYFKGEGK